jgi:hypothetical protein
LDTDNPFPTFKKTKERMDFILLTVKRPFKLHVFYALFHTSPFKLLTLKIQSKKPAESSAGFEFLFW